MIGEGSVDGRSGEKLHLLTQVVKSGFAKPAFVASNSRLKSNTITDCHILHSLPDFLNDARTFMADHHGLLHDETSAPQVLHTNQDNITTTLY